MLKRFYTPLFVLGTLLSYIFGAFIIANSMIPKDARLSANSVYGGIPVRKLDELS